MRRCWSGSSVLMYIRTLRSSTFPRLAWLDSTVSYRPLRVRLRIHGEVRSDQLGTNYSSTYKKLPRGELLYVGAFNRNRTRPHLTMAACTRPNNLRHTSLPLSPALLAYLIRCASRSSSALSDLVLRPRMLLAQHERIHGKGRSDQLSANKNPKQKDSLLGVFLFWSL